MSKQREAFEDWWDTIFAVDGKSYAWMAWQEARKQPALKPGWTEIDYNNPETWPEIDRLCVVGFSGGGNCDYMYKINPTDDGAALFNGTEGYDWVLPDGDYSSFQFPAGYPTHWCYAPVFEGVEQ